MSITDDMPILARHKGVWDGTYRYYDPKGDKTDEHRSRLLCRFKSDNEYHQTNYYYWADGKKEIRDFPAGYDAQKKRILFTDTIEGWAAEVKLDEHNRTIMLYWIRPQEQIHLYEMIQISDCGTKRNRVWHWFKNDTLFQRTLVDERKISEQYLDFERSAVLSYDDIASP